jgi:hypothetical protein
MLSSSPPSDIGMTTTEENGGLMTRQFSSQLETVQTAVAPRTQNPQLDERLWQAWVEKNKKLDKVKLARRVKAIAILVVLSALAALVHKVAG